MHERRGTIHPLHGAIDCRSKRLAQVEKSATRNLGSRQLNGVTVHWPGSRGRPNCGIAGHFCETPFHENGLPPAVSRPHGRFGNSADTALRKASERSRWIVGRSENGQFWRRRDGRGHLDAPNRTTGLATSDSTESCGSLPQSGMNRRSTQQPTKKRAIAARRRNQSASPPSR
jgi:hypothetical protein